MKLESRQIVWGTLIVGSLDALDAIVFFGLRNGATPVRIFQSIAYGLLGRETYTGGLSSALLGVAVHQTHQTHPTYSRHPARP